MKTSKLFTIDVELAERLKNTNASELVNSLLKEHFEVRSEKNTLLDQKKAALDQIIKKKERFRRILRLLNNLKLSILIILRRFGLEHALKNLWKVKQKNILEAEKAKFLRRIFSRHGK